MVSARCPQNWLTSVDGTPSRVALMLRKLLIVFIMIDTNQAEVPTQAMTCPRFQLVYSGKVSRSQCDSLDTQLIV